MNAMRKGRTPLLPMGLHYPILLHGATEITTAAACGVCGCGYSGPGGPCSSRYSFGATCLLNSNRHCSRNRSSIDSSSSRGVVEATAVDIAFRDTFFSSIRGNNPDEIFLRRLPLLRYSQVYKRAWSVSSLLFLFLRLRTITY